MLGKALIVHPVLAENVTEVQAYFPQDVWYDYESGYRIQLDSSNMTTLSA